MAEIPVLFEIYVGGVLTITSVELIQLVTLLGSMDIDDLILNLAGASIGFLIYIIITSVCNKRKKD